LGLGYLKHTQNNLLGYTGTNAGNRSPLACPEATESNKTVIGLNSNLTTNIPGLRGPSFTFPSRLSYISDSNVFEYFNLYQIKTTDSSSVSLRHGNRQSFNVVYADLHGDMRNKNSVTGVYVSQTVAYTPFWIAGPTWNNNGTKIAPPD
jgi:prepilin-type processing-associated H-X9-DG protein